MLTIFHKFRDAQLAKTDAGRSLTALYYKHEVEVSQILTEQNGLRAEARQLLFKLAPELFLGIYRKKDLTITQAQQNFIVGFMNQLKRTASPELQADIADVLARLSDGSLLRELGYTIR